MTTPPAKPAPSYRVDLVEGSSVIPVFSYNRTTGAFTATAYASGRCAITDAVGVRTFSIGGTDVLQINDDGRLIALNSYQVKCNPLEKRLEFVRITSSVRHVVGSVTESGIVSSFRFEVGDRPDTTDQVFLPVTGDMTKASVGQDGFIVLDGFDQINNVSVPQVLRMDKTDAEELITAAGLTFSYDSPSYISPAVSAYTAVYNPDTDSTLVTLTVDSRYTFQAGDHGYVQGIDAAYTGEQTFTAVTETMVFYSVSGDHEGEETGLSGVIYSGNFQLHYDTICRQTPAGGTTVAAGTNVLLQVIDDD